MWMWGTGRELQDRVTTRWWLAHGHRHRQWQKITAKNITKATAGQLNKYHSNRFTNNEPTELTKRTRQRQDLTSLAEDLNQSQCFSLLFASKAVRAPEPIWSISHILCQSTKSCNKFFFHFLPMTSSPRGHEKALTESNMQFRLFLISRSISPQLTIG